MTILRPFVSKDTLKIVHLRQSNSDLLTHASNMGMKTVAVRVRAGNSLFCKTKARQIPTPELDEFATWAFGSEGIQSLQVIACGDFSYGGRYSNGNICLGRAGEAVTTIGGDARNYLILGKSGRPFQELLTKYSNVLEACPVQPLMMTKWDDDGSS